MAAPKSEMLLALPNFYNNSGSLSVPEYYTDKTMRGGKRTADISLPPYYDTLRQPAIDAALQEIDDTYQCLQAGDYTFEVAFVNSSAAESERYRAFGSTINSSLATNWGNIAEFAVRGAAEPGQPMVYVAFFGNGLSTPLHGEDASYFQTTGRMTIDTKDGSGSVVAIKRLADALESAGIQVGEVTGDSAGGVLMSALATELGDRNQKVGQGFINNRPQFFDTSIPGMAYGALRTRHAARDERSYNWIDSYSVAQYTDDERKHIIAHTPRIHGHANQERVAAISGGASRWMGRMLLAASGFGHTASKADPLALDTSAFFRSNPDARLAIVFPEQDYLSGTGERVEDRLHTLLETIPVRGEGQLSMLVPASLTHNYDKYFPTVRAGMERYIFSGARMREGYLSQLSDTV